LIRATRYVGCGSNNALVARSLSQIDHRLHGCSTRHLGASGIIPDRAHEVESVASFFSNGMAALDQRLGQRQRQRIARVIMPRPRPGGNQVRCSPSSIQYPLNLV
jgi:hypothetical protein